MPKTRRKIGCIIPVICLMAAAEAGLFIFLQLSMLRVGYRIRQEEKRAQTLDDTRRLLNFKLAAAKAPGNIIREMNSRDIDLAECTDRRIVWLDEPVSRAEGIAELGSVMPERKDFLGLLYSENMNAAASKK